TRSAFTSVAHLTDENGDDILSPKATVQNSTSATIQAVESDLYGISYISLGSLNSSVKAVSIDEVEPTIENIQEGNYQLIRNFNVTYGQELSDVAEDFWKFMFSAQAQELVEEDGYVSVDTTAPKYEPSGLSGSISIVGSTSVEPTIKNFLKLIENSIQMLQLISLLPVPVQASLQQLMEVQILECLPENQMIMKLNNSLKQHQSLSMELL